MDTVSDNRLATLDREQLIDALADPDVGVAQEAAVALRAVTGMTLNFDPNADQDLKEKAVREWRDFWERDRSSPDFGNLRVVKARVLDVRGDLGNLTISAGARNRVAEHQTWTITKKIAGEDRVFLLEIIAVSRNQSVARVLDPSDVFYLAPGDPALYAAPPPENHAAG